MHAAGPGALGAVGGEEAGDLGEDVVEVAGLLAARRGERVAVHRVARPHHGVAGVAHGARAAAAGRPRSRSAPMRVMRVSRPGMRSGLSASQSARTSSGVAVGPSLQPIGLPMPREELDVGAVELAGALADPEHVGRAVVPVAGERVLAGERLLVAEDQRLVAGVEVDLVQVRLRLGVDAARLHEPQRPVDLVGHALVARGPRGSTATNSWFHGWTRARSAKPPLVNARSRFSVDADWW